jgi:hypothetical protein
MATIEFKCVLIKWEQASNLRHPRTVGRHWASVRDRQVCRLVDQFPFIAIKGVNPASFNHALKHLLSASAIHFWQFKTLMYPQKKIQVIWEQKYYLQKFDLLYEMLTF